MIKKNVVKLCLIIITSLILPLTYTYGSTNKGDIKIKVFKLNDKNEIPSKELRNEEGIFFCCFGGDGDDLGRIEISSINESKITIQIEDNDTKRVILNGNIPSDYGKNKVTFGVFPWVKICDYGGTGLSVRVFSNDEPILQFKYYSGDCVE
jgi:hypothetical protein